MTDINFGSTSNDNGFTAGYVYVAGISLPSGRAMASGSTSVLITALRGWVAGNGGTRSVKMSLAGAATASFNVAAGTPVSTGFKSTNAKLVNGGSATFRYDFGGSTYFSRGGSGTSVGQYGSFSGTLGGSYRYGQAPTAPGFTSLVQQSPTAMGLTWTAPTDDGDATVTGYRVQYATNAAFTGATTVDTGSALSFTVTGLTPGLTLFVRVAARNAVTAAASSSSVWSATKQVTLVATVGDLDGWSAYGTLPAGTSALIGTGIRRGGVWPVAGASGLLREIKADTASGAPVVSEALGLKRTVTGLKVGYNYRLTGMMVSLSDVTPPGNLYAFKVTGKASGTSAAVTNTTTPVAIPTYNFVASATTHVLEITLKEAASWSATGWFENAGFYNVKLFEVPDASPYRLKDTVYEGPLADHFAYACDSVGASWWVDADNVTQFRQARSQDANVAIFTDERAPGALEYTDIAASYDTRNVVNQLEVENHGRNAVTGDADDQTYTASDAASMTAWGTRSGSMDMTLYSGYADVTNLLLNPSAEVTADNWLSGSAATTIARSTTEARTGISSMRCVATSGTSHTSYLHGSGGFDALPGEQFSASVWVKITSGTGSATMNIRSTTSAGVTVTNYVSSAVTVNSTGWTRVSHTASLPGATVAKVTAFITITGVTTTRHSYLDDAMLNRGTLIDQFDGDTARTADLVYSWTGTPHASPSERRNFTVLNTRIAEVLEDHKTPGVGISSLVWNAQENPAVASMLEVQDRVRVNFEGQVQDSRILGIDHDMTAERWMITLELGKT